MIGGFVFAAALSVAAPLALAPIEDWRAVDGVDDVDAKFWIDMDSIKLDGAITHFRLRVVVPNFDGFAYVDSVANCGAKTVEMRHMDLKQGDKIVKSEDFAPGTQEQSLEDEQGLIIKALVCK